MNYYYFHKNGSLIYKKFEPELDSPFVVKVWEADLTNRMDAWRVVLESLALGANEERITELADKWKLGFDDAIEMLRRAGSPGDLMKKGFEKFVPLVLKIGVDEFWESAKKQG